MLSQLRSKPDAFICSLFVVVSQTEDQQSDIEDLNKVSSRMDSMVLLVHGSTLSLKHIDHHFAVSC